MNTETETHNEAPAPVMLPSQAARQAQQAQDDLMIFTKTQLSEKKQAAIKSGGVKPHTDSFYIGSFRFDICEVEKETKQADSTFAAICAAQLEVGIEELKSESFRVDALKSQKYDQLLEERYDRAIEDGLCDWTLPLEFCERERKDLLIGLKAKIYKRIIALSRYGADDDSFSKS